MHDAKKPRGDEGAEMNDSIRDWQRYLSGEKDRSENTVRLYTATLEALQREVGEPETLSTPDLRRWLQSRPGQAGTVANRISALKSYYQYLVRFGVRKDDPSSDLVAPRHRPPPGKPVDDLAAILDRLDEEDRRANRTGVIPRRVGESRDMAIFLAETGLRISEAVKCEWPLPCPPEAVVVRGRKSERVTLSQAARDAWDSLEGKWPIGARATQRRFEKLNFNPHQLRHWYKAHKASSHSPQATAERTDLRPAQPGEVEALLANYSNSERSLIRAFLQALLDECDNASISS
jgi:integrase